MDRYAVFGNPIAHSLSPQIHCLFAEQTGDRLTYDKVEIAEDQFEAAVGNFFDTGGRGLNITLPFKLRALQLADELTERARMAGAVNTLAAQGGRILGDNTDGAGLVADILQQQGWKIAGRRLLLLGAGGAVRGVLQPLLAQQPGQLVIANRTLSRAQDLERLFQGQGPVAASTLADLHGCRFDLVINGTSASLSGAMPPLPENLLADGADCYDMVYAAQPTVFLRWAQQHGCRHCADGLGMLVGQAAESFLLWRGTRPRVGPILDRLRSQLRT